MSLRRRLGLITLDYPTPQECLEAVRDRGLGCMELYIDRSDDAEVRSLARWAARRDVEITALSTLSKLGSAEVDLADHVAAVSRSIRLAGELGIRRAGFMFGGSSDLGGRAARRRFAERVLALAEQAARCEVQLVVENVFTRSAGVDLESVEDIEDLMGALPPHTVALTFDPANLAIAGEDAYPYAYTRLRPHISAVHLKDVTRHVQQVHGADPECRPLIEARRGRSITVPLGEGSLNMRGLVQALRTEMPEVPLLLEPFRSGRSRERWLDRSLAFLSAEEEMIDALT
ncbi:sugar phosphate isomerase/epimerase family protein [Agromyces aerolatus]|uniref:sugar phosphate isomerase/epimerase family protein n=1 Tax=Agromyces sp. LY-1074 TaxID=3074080 RepID=UPI00286770D5|nr:MULTISPECIES: sugar phosphate isomerase/epimerase [unclassified Agromyces]MDR5700854.1 sugar phosphate isomerase/epimerase [Agromyces sp. LY-1074]MDR5707485.1 sugar phosphate isomerase/epimerase [Agromyces sp. LY-1358]